MTTQKRGARMQALRFRLSNMWPVPRLRGWWTSPGDAYVYGGGLRRDFLRIVLTSAAVAGVVLASVTLVIGVRVWRVPEWYLVAHQGTDATAINEYRVAMGPLLSAAVQLLGGGLLTVGLYMTWRQLLLLRHQHANESFDRAVSNLGAVSVDVRIGAMAVLEQLAIASREHYWLVADTLATTVKERFAEVSARYSPATGPVTLPVDGAHALGILARLSYHRPDRCDRFAKAQPGDFYSRDPYKEPRHGVSLDGLQAAHTRADHFVFRGATLHKGSFEGAACVGARFEGVSLNFASFAGADLRGATFRTCSMFMCDFTGANLLDAIFEFNHIQNAVFDLANLENARFYRSTWVLTSARGARFVGTSFLQTHIDATNDLTGAVVVDVKLTEFWGQLTHPLFSEFVERQKQGKEPL